MAVADNALCTLAQLKTYLNISGSSQDSALEDLVDAVSAGAEAYTRRELAARDQAWTGGDALDGNGHTVLRAPQWPLNSISSLEVNGVEISARAAIGGSGYVIDKGAGLIRLVGYVFYQGVQNVEISANAGFDPVPADLRQAAIEWAAMLVKQSGISGLGKHWLGIKSDDKPKNMGTVQLSQGEPPRQVAAKLRIYRRKAGL